MKNGKRFAKIFVLVFCALLVLSSSAKALVYDSSGRAPDGTSWHTWGDRAVIDTFSDSPFGRNEYAGIFKQNCIMFVRLVLKLENDAGYNRGWLSSYKWDIDNAHGRELYSYGGATVVAQHRNDRHGTLTAAILEEKFSQAHTADVVQMYWNSSQHTALINGFEERNGQRGVHFFQANPTVRDNFYPFEELASKYNAPGNYGGFTIYCFGHGPGGDAPDWKNPPPVNDINPGLLKLNTGNYAKCFTLENKEYRGGSSGLYSGYLYTDSSLSELKPYENWTGKDDEIYLTGVGKKSDGTIWGRISYPSGSNRVTVYVKLQDVLVSDGTITKDEPKKAKVSHYGMYKRRDSGYESSYGIDVGDDVYLLTRSNGWCQVMYPITGQTYWRIAWLKESDYRKVIGEIKPLEITEVPNALVIAGQNYNFQCEANGDADVWSSTQGTRPSGSSTNVKTTMPPGLSINRNTGRISGTVEHTSLGKSSNTEIYYNFKVNASGSGNSAEKGAFIGVVEPPVITTDRNLPNGSLRQEYNQTITAEGTARGMKWKLKSGSLPDGLTLNPSNSTRHAEQRNVTIKGTPTREGTYTFTLELYNDTYGFLGTSKMRTRKTFTIKIGRVPPPDPNLYIAYTFMNGKVGKYYNDWVAARGRTSINRFEVSGNYPTGLSFYRSGLYIYMYGTPEESGTFEFTITVYSDYGYANKTFRVYIAPKDTRPYPDPNMSIVYTLCNGSLGNTYGDYVRVSGGTSPYTVQAVSGTLPPGLSTVVEGNKIWIRGVPVRYSSTPYTFRLRVTGAHNGYVEKDLKIKISNNSAYSLAGAGDPDKPTKPKLLTKKLPTAAVGNEVNVQLEAYGTTPITWSCAEVPEGFIFTDTGVIMGVPMEAKNLKFKVTATNSAGSAAKTFSLKVKPEKPLITTLALPDGVVGLPYEFTAEASGTEPLTWSKSGKFPAGLKIDKKTGTISGTPTKAGTYEFKLKAKNKGGTDTLQMTMVINAEEQEKTSSVSASSLVQAAQVKTESRGSVNTELFLIADGEETDDDIITDAGQPLTFKLGAWVDDAGDEVEASDVQIYVNDEPVNDAFVAEDGTFTLPGEYVSGEFSVSARAKHGDSELETSDINVTAEVHEAHNEETALSNSDSSGSCSMNLFGFAGLALCALTAFRKK